MNIIEKSKFNDVFKEVLCNSSVASNLESDRVLKQLISTPIKHMCANPKFSDIDYLEQLTARCFELSETDDRDLEELKRRIFNIVKHNRVVGFGGVF